MGAESKRTIIVTGVTKGLGRALADRFAERGHTVVGCGRTAAAIDQLLSQFDETHHFSVVDVGSDESVQGWAEQVLAEYGAPDLLINNAAVINENAPLWEISAEEFNRLTAININGVANVIRRFAPAMIERGSGVIINLSSGWGRATSADVAPYCASKWAIEGLTLALAQELPAGMAAVPLNPGIVNTDMLQSCFGQSANHYSDAEQWSAAAADFILNITAEDNGRQLTAPS